jgi:hypothetical protein
MAVGLGSMDMPVPAVAAWEWLNWKFPRAVHAGDTVYARWTLTQKRPPVGGEPTAIVVWRVDVHTADGALCAEGEVGAGVLRKVGTEAAQVGEAPAVASPAPRRRGRRRTSGGDGAKKPTEAAQPAPQPVPAPATAGAADRAAGRPRRRRRRRSPGAASAARNGDAAAPAAPVEAPSAPAPVAASSPASAATGVNPLTRAIRRLRRP